MVSKIGTPLLRLLARPHTLHSLMCHKYLSVILCLAGCLVVSVGAFAAPPEKTNVPVHTDERIESAPFFTFEHSGYFRLRNDLFVNPDLGNGVGGMKAPLKGDSTAASNMRFRWRPLFKLGQKLRVGSVIDVLDNVVLGSSPTQSSGWMNSALSFDSETQASPQSNTAIRVKQLWGEWDFLYAMTIRAGRVGDHFGMGMVHNDGNCQDCDFGDYTDRVSAEFSIYGVRMLWFLDFPGEGATTATRIDAFGQPYDAEQLDDVNRWGFSIGSVPVTVAEKEERRRKLGSGRVVIDWGVRNTFTSQELSSDVQPVLPDCPSPTSNPLDTPPECTVVKERGADYWVPDLWMKLQWRPSHSTFFRFEIEAAALYGSVEYTQNLSSPSSSKDFVGFGAVTQLELQHHRWDYLLELGLATGDDLAFGSYGPGYHDPIDTNYGGNAKVRGNADITRFLFSRDYHVDLLMYREVIGTVTNSFYAKPTIRAYLIKSDTQRVGAQFSTIYGHAMNDSSTPGKSGSLGLELDAKIFYEVPNRFKAEFEGGFLIPFDGFNNPNGANANTAYTLQMRMTMAF